MVRGDAGSGDESLLDPEADLPAEVEPTVLAFDPCSDGVPAATAVAMVRVVEPAP